MNHDPITQLAELQAQLDQLRQRFGHSPMADLPEIRADVSASLTSTVSLDPG